ncbi:glutaredoxin 3 [Bartonella sp. HY329]|uniref:glutaredoxin 3 n=1 Tax=unclassified Bartonella TaxID=2645622 RepID=UPI0021C674A9|nr:MULTISPECIES: glutaredoxin 3 [unclassified Bartonella]UXM95551.1 glutaredoxin 3 [Bartonella sp. HY329]UXN09876.1 glutaredoxin 3 [Bartonella sp. HY328]
MSITIYIKTGCPYCAKALALLEQKNVEFTTIEAASDPQVRAQMRERANGRNTFPQIFIGDIHVGGCDDLFALDEAGKLDELLQSHKKGN